MILDARRVGEASFDGVYLDLRAYLLAFYPKAEIPPMDHVVRTADPLVAEIHHGVWIARCPCGARGVPRPGSIVDVACPLVWCVRCGNQAVGGGWRPVLLPPEEDRAAIEAVLLCRPSVEDRNWEPGETLADLAAQNREHGDPVPEEAG